MSGIADCVRLDERWIELDDRGSLQVLGSVSTVRIGVGADEIVVEIADLTVDHAHGIIWFTRGTNADFACGALMGPRRSINAYECGVPGELGVIRGRLVDGGRGQQERPCWLQCVVANANRQQQKSRGCNEENQQVKQSKNGGKEVHWNCDYVTPKSPSRFAA